MSEIIIQFINQLIPELLTLLALVVIFYLRKLTGTWLPKIEEWVNAHTTAQQREMIYRLGQEAFVYAETVFKEKSGAEKLNEAIAYFRQHMSQCGLTNLSVEVIRAAIERAWLADKRSEIPVITAELGEVKTAGGAE